MTTGVGGQGPGGNDDEENDAREDDVDDDDDKKNMTMMTMTKQIMNMTMVIVDHSENYATHQTYYQ